jgi:hypothetical protein
VSGLCEKPHGMDHLRDSFQRIDREFCTTAKLEQRQDVELTGSIAVIDLADGEYIKAMLLTDVKSITFANWKPAPIVNRVTLEVNSKGKFFADLSWVKFPDGVDVSFSNDATVVFSIVSSDAGKTVFCDHVQTYSRKIDDPTPITPAYLDLEPVERQLR